MGGGGINISGHEEEARIVNCIITDNTLTKAAWSYAGAGIRFWDSAGGRPGDSPRLEVVNCIISNNATPGDGDGIAMSGSKSTRATSRTGRVILLNCTITDNSAAMGGGVLAFANAEVTLSNCILRDNTATEGNQIAVTAYRGVGASTATVSYSAVEGGSSQVHVELGSTLKWGAGQYRE